MQAAAASVAPTDFEACSLGAGISTVASPSVSIASAPVPSWLNTTGSQKHAPEASSVVPGDITGNPVLQEIDGRREFVFQPGPLFAQVVLADEIDVAAVDPRFVRVRRDVDRAAVAKALAYEAVKSTVRA